VPEGLCAKNEKSILLHKQIEHFTSFNLVPGTFNFGQLFPILCHFGEAAVYAHCFEKIGLKNKA
jgi:hypothetical protein